MQLFLFFAALANGMVLVERTDGLYVQDTAAPGGCTGGGSCCEPSCTIGVTNVNGCSSGSVQWSGRCLDNYNNPQGTQDVGGCDGYTMGWAKGSQGSGAVVTITKTSDGSIDPFSITDCQTPSTGGTQCAPSGGGCTASLTF